MKTIMKAHIILLQEQPVTCYGFFWNLYYKRRQDARVFFFVGKIPKAKLKGTKKSEKGRERAKTV
jgi:hypothetical protein